MSDNTATSRPRRGRGRPRKDELTSPETRDRLLEAAEEAFVEFGYEGVTLSDIVRRAGYTTGAIYNHFDGKAELLIEVVRRVLARIFQVVFESAGSEGIDGQSRALVDTWFALPPADRITLAEVHLAAVRHERVATLLHSAISEATEASRVSIENARAAGDTAPDIDAARVAKLVMVFCAGLNHLDTIDPDLPADDRSREIVGDWLTALYRSAPSRQGGRARFRRRDRS